MPALPHAGGIEARDLHDLAIPERGYSRHGCAGRGIVDSPEKPGAGEANRTPDPNLGNLGISLLIISHILTY
jgi:hypothetical protein